MGSRIFVDFFGIEKSSQILGKRLLLVKIHIRKFTVRVL
jgi:hypothetical protein